MQEVPSLYDFPHINLRFDYLGKHDQAACLLPCRHLQCGVALRVYPQWLKYLSNTPFFFMFWSAFALAFGLL